MIGAVIASTLLRLIAVVMYTYLDAPSARMRSLGRGRKAASHARSDARPQGGSGGK